MASLGTFCFEAAIEGLELKYWIESALDVQRFFGLLGYLYTADPKGYAQVPGTIPEKGLNRLASGLRVKQRDRHRLSAPYWRT